MADLNQTDDYRYDPLPIERIVLQFEKTFRKGPRPSIDVFLEGDGIARFHLLLELINSELELRLQAGELARVHEYVERYPALKHSPNELARLIETEVRLRLQAKESLSIGEYRGRYSVVDGQAMEQLFRRVGGLPPEMAEYEQLEEIGSGGMGEVYRARDKALRREIAIKILKDKYAGSPDAIRRFQDEARFMGQLQHPSIPAVHQLGVMSDDRPFLAMKLIKGRTLQELLKDPTSTINPLAVFDEQARDSGSQADDTGTEIELPDDDEHRSGTRAGSTLGTLANTPPEQAAGAWSLVDEQEGDEREFASPLPERGICNSPPISKSSPTAPLSRSPPRAPRRRSIPFPPRSKSLLTWPSRASSPPIRRSALVPLRSVSLPLPPSSRSRPSFSYFQAGRYSPVIGS